MFAKQETHTTRGTGDVPLLGRRKSIYNPPAAKQQVGAKFRRMKSVAKFGLAADNLNSPIIGLSSFDPACVSRRLL